MKSFIEIASGLCPLQRQTASDCHEPIPSALAMTKRGSHCEERDSFVCHCEECNDEAISLLMKIFVGTQCDLLCRFAFATIL